MSESCANCGRTIGPLETPYLFGESVVCFQCHGRLIAESLGHPPQPTQPPQPSYQQPAHQQPYEAPRRPYYYPPPKYEDKLGWVRLIILIFACLTGLVAGLNTLSAGLFLMWILLGVYHLIRKAGG
jgi:hypothetical protein